MPQVSSHQLQKIYIECCEAELSALKPGNVHIYAAGHGMTVEHFRHAAQISAPFLAKPNQPVGARIEAAVTACVAELKLNVNLGIILLAAPMLAARETMGSGDGLPQFREALGNILENLTLEDAKATCRAIALANPAGLGLEKEQDVRQIPTKSLFHVMNLAANRDRIAYQYSHNFNDVLSLGFNRIRHSLDIGLTYEMAITACYLEFFSVYPDSHIARKYGVDKSVQIRDAAQSLISMIGLGNGLQKQHKALLDWDEKLKIQGINPGTSADLTVASLLASKLTCA
ncbi:MAG: triphosphoribosyl-dephospho-CoA synthase [Candidatus Symbiobacter sp.]|nr:triphosphoribosyl-dephospho-CoA synthase [Candidatus Symbiobacter sp.]